MFSAFSEWVTSAADAVNKISDQGLEAVRQAGIIDALQSATLSTGSPDTAGAAHEQQLAVKDLMTPPTGWAGSAEEWQWCVEAAMNDPNTCAITPATMRQDDNLWQEVHSLMTGVSKREPPMEAASTTVASSATTTTNTATSPATAALANTAAMYTPSADLIAFVQSHPSIHQVRSYVVPLFTSDEDYWLNLGWRLTLYRLCENTADLLTVMQAVSKLPARLHEIADREKRAAEAAAAKHAAVSVPADSKNGGNGSGDEEEEEGDEYIEKRHLRDNTAYWRAMRQQCEADRERYAWLRDTQERVRKEMELARGNVKLLESLLQRQQASSALGVSVCDSCKYHKVKLSRLIADICAAAMENTRGTVLDLETGVMFHELFQCNESVKNVLHACASRGVDGSGGSPKAQPPQQPNTSTATSPLRESLSRHEVSASRPQSAEVRSTASPTTPSFALISAKSSVHNPAAASRSDSDSEVSSFEAKLPWSMDD